MTWRQRVTERMYDWNVNRRNRAAARPTFRRRFEDARYTTRRYIGEHSNAFKALTATIFFALPIIIFTSVAKKPKSNCEKLHGSDATQAKCGTEAMINDKIEKDVAQAKKTISDQEKRENAVAVIYDNKNNYIQKVRQCSNAAVQAKVVCEKNHKSNHQKYVNIRNTLIAVPVIFYTFTLMYIFWAE